MEIIKNVNNQGDWSGWVRHNRGHNIVIKFQERHCRLVRLSFDSVIRFLNMLLASHALPSSGRCAFFSFAVVQFVSYVLPFTGT